MKERRTYDTVSEAVNDLGRRGYTTAFSIMTDKERLKCTQTDKELSPDEFEIDELYRFEGNTDPGDEMIVFAISSNEHQLKGVLVNAFGTYSDGNTSKITRRLTQHL